MFKRPYLADYNKSRHFISVGNFTMITITGMCNSMVQTQDQLKIYLDELENENSRNPMIKMQSDLKKKHAKEKMTNSLKLNLLRSSTVVLIRYFLEFLGVKNLPPRIADKLTKNLDASALRKLKKHNKLVCIEKIFFTSYRRNLLNSFSIYFVELVCDISRTFFNFELFAIFQSKRAAEEEKAKRSKLPIKTTSQKTKDVMIRLLHRSVFTSTSLIYNSFGYAIGCAVLGPSFGGLLFSFAFELGADMAIRPLMLKALPKV